LGVDLEYLRTGHGAPVTVFAPGLGSGIADTRPLGSGVSGTRVFFQFRGHGRSAAPGRRWGCSASPQTGSACAPPGGAWTYADLAADLAAVADAHGATRALGVSLGAAALCRLVAGAPTRFDRLVFFLPAALDGPGPTERLEALLAGGDALRAAVAAEVPAGWRETATARGYVRQRVDWLTRHPLAPALAGLRHDVPVPDLAALRAVRVPALVVGCEGDGSHPAAVARRLAGSLGNATLHVYDEPAVLWTARADLRDRVSGFLAE
jgi:3-oxoadipate enol-lactonase